MENDSQILVLGQPTIKDQLIGAGIAIGTTLVMLLVLSGFGALVEKVADLKRRRKANKILKAQTLLKESGTSA